LQKLRKEAKHNRYREREREREREMNYKQRYDSLLLFRRKVSILAISTRDGTTK
jgi:hypothetical protein